MELKGNTPDVVQPAPFVPNESIQWNWKIEEVEARLNEYDMVNPFNGIESLTGRFIQPLVHAFLSGIHSMELKEGLTLAYLSITGLRIHSMELKDPCHL
jgi:hypothetical protein